MSNLSALERETIANYNQQETEACVFTYDTVLQRKLDKLCAERPDEIKMTVECNGSKNYVFPKKWFKITPPRKSNMTDEQKAAGAARLKALREAKKVNG